ncbi:hypothetical protein LACDD01_01531 [Lactococcus sp. DD01]|nr:hypothetical protein LACDD01_01531 [Lactococcus sp. DD01]
MTATSIRFFQPVWKLELIKAEFNTSSALLPREFTYSTITTRSSVIVPVLSVQSISIEPRFWIADRFFTMTFSLLRATAPLAKFALTIMGSISGVRPTATAMAKKNDVSKSPFVTQFKTKTTGNIIATKVNRRRLTRLNPLSKADSTFVAVALLAISPNMVEAPVLTIKISPFPDKTSVPIKRTFGASSADVTSQSICSSSSKSSGKRFSTGKDSPVKEA